MMCLYNGSTPRNRAMSEVLGYGLKIVISPTRAMKTKSGWSGKRTVNAPTYPIRCIQKTPMKKLLKASKISMKKYHHNPIFGVKSVTVICAP